MHVHLLLDFFFLKLNSATDVDLLFELSVLKYQLKISLIPEQPSNLTHKQEGHDGPLSLTRVNGHVFCHIKISLRNLKEVHLRNIHDKL